MRQEENQVNSLPGFEEIIVVLWKLVSIFLILLLALLLLLFVVLMAVMC